MRKNTPKDIFAKISIDLITGCGIWHSDRDKDGYPLVSWHGKTTRVTRLIWTFTHGPIAEGFQVLHSCDNPGCVNIEHFFLGTSADNRADCVAKNRQARGLKNGRHTHPESTARSERHGWVTHPESVPRGEHSGRYGKPAAASRGPDGKFNGPIHHQLSPPE